MEFVEGTWRLPEIQVGVSKKVRQAWLDAGMPGLGHEMGAIFGAAQYFKSENEISLHTGDCDEEEAVHTLCHEVNHWAHLMYGDQVHGDSGNVLGDSECDAMLELAANWGVYNDDEVYDFTPRWCAELRAKKTKAFALCMATINRQRDNMTWKRRK